MGEEGTRVYAQQGSAQGVELECGTLAGRVVDSAQPKVDIYPSALARQEWADVDHQIPVE